MRVIVIGGGASGSSFATRFRRLNENAEILILEKSGENSIATCGLPYYIGDVIHEREKLEVAKTSLFKNLFNIEIKHYSKVVKILPLEKQVVTADGQIYSYDKLVVATGAGPIIPHIKGVENIASFSIKSLSNADNIKSFIQEKQPKSALILGAGFIGLELAENLTTLGIQVTLVDKADQVLTSVDEDMIFQVQNHLREKGVRLCLSSSILEFKTNETILTSGEIIQSDMVVFANGIKPETEFMVPTGIHMDENGAIYTNEYMQTNVPDIYACGDNVLVKDFVIGEYHTKALAGPANRQGRLIADHIMGNKYSYTGTQGTGIIKVFDLTVAFTGASEVQLQKANILYHQMVVTGSSRAGYYPEPKELMLKVLYNDEGKILGASCVGEEGVDKRIDVIATIMRLNGTVEDLRDAELCYAPPYSGAKDILNLMGMAIDNIRKALVKPYFGTDFEGMLVLDVRPSGMFQKKHIQGAINIPFMEIRQRVNELPKDKPIMIHCVRGYTSYVVARYLLQNGFKMVFSYAGGWRYYKMQQQI